MGLGWHQSSHTVCGIPLTLTSCQFGTNIDAGFVDWLGSITREGSYDKVWVTGCGSGWLFNNSATSIKQTLGWDWAVAGYDGRTADQVPQELNAFMGRMISRPKAREVFFCPSDDGDISRFRQETVERHALKAVPRDWAFMIVVYGWEHGAEPQAEALVDLDKSISKNHLRTRIDCAIPLRDVGVIDRETEAAEFFANNMVPEEWIGQLWFVDATRIKARQEFLNRITARFDTSIGKSSREYGQKNALPVHFDSEVIRAIHDAVCGCGGTLALVRYIRNPWASVDRVYDMVECRCTRCHSVRFPVFRPEVTHRDVDSLLRQYQRWVLR